MFNLSPQAMIFFLATILLALTVHEFSHGYVAYLLGDDTAKRAGRLTLNPLAHLDPLGTLFMLIARFGWAKPVPVNLANLRNPRRDSVLVALAGPGSNILLAVAFGAVMRLLALWSPWGAGSHALIGPLERFCMLSITINLALAIFNLLPLPPLDGSKILSGLLPLRQALSYHRFAAVGPMLLFALILLGQVGNFSPFYYLVWVPVRFLQGILL